MATKLPSASTTPAPASKTMKEEKKAIVEPRFTDVTEKKEFLVLPAGLPIPEVALADVGTGRAMNNFDCLYLLAVYALNKAACNDTTNNNNIRFGLARMEAVLTGWFKDQHDVRMEQVPANLLEFIFADESIMLDLLPAARDASWLVPLAIEYVFRTKGRHFVGPGRAEYIEGYETILRASLMPDVGNFMPPDLLYYSAFHWITPERIWTVLQAHAETDRIPDAVKLRMTSAPAGSALITTTAAVLRTFSAGGFLVSDFVGHNIVDVDEILKLDKIIRANPPKYHMTPIAYGLPYLDGEEKMVLEKAKEKAKKISPVLQAFCDTMLKESSLGKQKVLRKYSNNNPSLNLSARRFFQEVDRYVPKSLAEVFDLTRKRKRFSPAGQEIDDEVED